MAEVDQAGTDLFSPAKMNLSQFYCVLLPIITGARIRSGHGNLGARAGCLQATLRSGKRPVAIMSLIQSVRINGRDPYVYLKDVLTRLPPQRASEIAELLSHVWAPV